MSSVTFKTFCIRLLPSATQLPPEPPRAAVQINECCPNTTNIHTTSDPSGDNSEHPWCCASYSTLPGQFIARLCGSICRWVRPVKWLSCCFSCCCALSPPSSSSCFWSAAQRGKGRASKQHLLHSAADALAAPFCSPIILLPEKSFSGLEPP